MTNHLKPKYMRRHFTVMTPVTRHLAWWLRVRRGWQWEEIVRYLGVSKKPIQQAVRRIADWEKMI